MNILKGFMIFGSICYMFLACADNKSENIFIRDIVGMLACALIAILIHNFC